MMEADTTVEQRNKIQKTLKGASKQILFEETDSGGNKIC